ncbi:hypothetical protein [Achromobacter denitrificans]|nr:hypothetical protein [Achromobacter denitrificans]
MSAFIVAAVLTAVIFGYGDRQQRDEQAQSPIYPTCEGCGKTVVVAKE